MHSVMKAPKKNGLEKKEKEKKGNYTRRGHLGDLDRPSIHAGLLIIYRIFLN